MNVLIYTTDILGLPFVAIGTHRAYTWEGSIRDLPDIVKDITAEYQVTYWNSVRNFNSTKELLEYINYITAPSLLRRYESKM